MPPAPARTSFQSRSAQAGSISEPICPVPRGAQEMSPFWYGHGWNPSGVVADYNKLHKEYKELENQLEESEGNLKEAHEELAEANETIEGLKVELQNTKANIRKSGGNTKALLNQELVTHTQDAGKIFTFRTWKFIEDQRDLDLATEETIKYLKVALPMPKEEYIKDYGQIMNKAIKLGRQTVQSEGKKRAGGTKTLCKLQNLFCANG